MYVTVLHHLQYYFDYQPGEVYACVADIGWITGHSYVVYGPLCNGATTVLFESTPTYPDACKYTFTYIVHVHVHTTCTCTYYMCIMSVSYTHLTLPTNREV